MQEKNLACAQSYKTISSRAFYSSCWITFSTVISFFFLNNHIEFSFTTSARAMKLILAVALPRTPKPESIWKRFFYVLMDIKPRIFSSSNQNTSRWDIEIVKIKIKITSHSKLNQLFLFSAICILENINNVFSDTLRKTYFRYHFTSDPLKLRWRDTDKQIIAISLDNALLSCGLNGLF